MSDGDGNSENILGTSLKSSLTYVNHWKTENNKIDLVEQHLVNGRKLVTLFPAPKSSWGQGESGEIVGMAIKIHVCFFLKKLCTVKTQNAFVVSTLQVSKACSLLVIFRAVLYKLPLPWKHIIKKLFSLVEINWC